MLMPSLQRRRLLVVEDDRMVRDTIVLLLEEDYEVHLASSVETALCLLRTDGVGSIDVLLLDCLLPGGDPADVLAEADRQHIPVVLISGDIRQRERFGSDRRFLPKPFTQGRLLATLDTARR